MAVVVVVLAVMSAATAPALVAVVQRLDDALATALDTAGVARFESSLRAAASRVLLPHWGGWRPGSLLDSREVTVAWLDGQPGRTLAVTTAGGTVRLEDSLVGPIGALECRDPVVELLVAEDGRLIGLVISFLLRGGRSVRIAAPFGSVGMGESG